MTKRTFVVLFFLFLIVYVFLDGGGVMSKEWKDFLVIPFLAFALAAFFTALTYLTTYLFRLIVK